MKVLSEINGEQFEGRPVLFAIAGECSCGQDIVMVGPVERLVVSCPACELPVDLERVMNEAAMIAVAHSYNMAIQQMGAPVGPQGKVKFDAS